MIANVQRSSTGPLAERDLRQIYERIMDVMRTIQKHAIVPDSGPATRDAESDSEFKN